MQTCQSGGTYIFVVSLHLLHRLLFTVARPAGDGELPLRLHDIVIRVAGSFLAGVWCNPGLRRNLPESRTSSCTTASMLAELIEPNRMFALELLCPPE